MNTRPCAFVITAPASTIAPAPLLTTTNPASTSSATTTTAAPTAATTPAPLSTTAQAAVVSSCIATTQPQSGCTFIGGTEGDCSQCCNVGGNLRTPAGGTCNFPPNSQIKQCLQNAPPGTNQAFTGGNAGGAGTIIGTCIANRSPGNSNAFNGQPGSATPLTCPQGAAQVVFG
ncbi:hypothetical protein RvY_12299 [Ramazzottius varieornatus]|uniref:Uncharacterized protein n=1 Tax=Ramazzottius varieornatus TaxID=947166 RepID=A0A1D1VN87_RAMVA|nr:hypothetical protein RvY_12299 [Ramazzottius varieornatus]